MAAAASAAMASSFDRVCSGGSSSSDDEEKQPLMKEHQSLVEQNHEQSESYRNSQWLLQQQTNGSSFPRIDLMNMNVNMSVNLEDFDFNLLPHEIQMALEDTLLGWTHLTSITIGHLLLPCLVFYTVQQASKYVLEQTVYTLDSSAQTPAVAYANMTIEEEMGQAIETILVSPTTHAILGAVAAIAAFRVIRDRRRVWFRHAYGSKEYMSCEEGRRRRAAVLATDRRHSSLLSISDAAESTRRRTWTSEMVTSYKRKRHHKKLQKASDRFERHHSNISPKSQESSSSIASPRSRLNAKQHRKYWQGSSEYDTTSVSPTEDLYDSSSSTDSSEHEEDFPRDTRRSRTSIAHDAVSIPRIHNVPYAHGGFFGAAPFFLADKRWVKILRELLPDVYVEISRRVGGGYYMGRFLGHSTEQDASKLIHWAENNPVVAAYGVVMDLQMRKELAMEEYQHTKSLCQDEPLLVSEKKSANIIEEFYHHAQEQQQNETTLENENQIPREVKVEIPNLEWDIFVDPQLVRRVEAVLNAKERYIQSKKKDKRNQTVVSDAATMDQSESDACPCCNDQDNTAENTEAVALLADQDQKVDTSFTNLCAANTNSCVDCFQSGRNDIQHDDVDADGYEDLDRPTTSIDDDDDDDIVTSDDLVLQYLEHELKRRTQLLTDRLLIAHGNVLQLILEQAGVLKDWNYSRVQRTRRTLGGGMYARQWMAVFAESLQLGMKAHLLDPTQTAHCRCRMESPGAATCSSADDEDFSNFYDDDDDDIPGEDAALFPLLETEHEDDTDRIYPTDHVDNNKNDFDADPGEDDGHFHCTCSPKCFLDTTMAESLALIERITQTKQPIGILLDLKSRHVPKRVLSLIVQSLQAAGIRVVGLASFEISEIRGVCSNNFYNLYDNANPRATKEILMVHSAGDLQAACDEGLVRPGDHVFFNGGSLILDSARSSTIKSLLGFFFDMCVCGYYKTFDPCAIEDGYRIQSYGYACSGVDTADCFSSVPYNSFLGNDTSGKATEIRSEDGDDDAIAMSSSEQTEMNAVMRTLADYKRHYGFSMGLYLQEFSIDEAAARLLIELVNNNPSLYDLGLAWGGINGMTVHGIQPGRFTSTDGYWNQRRLGKSWKEQF